MADDWFDGQRGGGGLSAVVLLDSAAGQGVAELVDAGALVGLGLTRDGGALMVQVTVDGRYRREYFRNEDDLGSWIAEALPAVRAAVEASSASSGRGPRERRRRGL
jgi:hypothetical protein